MATRNDIIKGWENPVTQLTPYDPENPNVSTITVSPEEPVKLTRDPITKQAVQVLYGDIDRMRRGDPVVMWTEDILRDPLTNKVIGIQTMRPNGVMTIEHIHRDVDGKFLSTTLEYL